MGLIRGDMADVTLSDNDTFDLLLILETYIERQSQELAQAIQDEKSGKKTALFDNHTDFIAALEAYKNKAQMLMTAIQQQTGITVLTEQAINRL